MHIVLRPFSNKPRVSRFPLDSRVWGLKQEVITNRVPFLSPNQQHQSSEGWQCSWLGTARCHYATKIGQEHCDGCVGSLGCPALWLQGIFSPMIITAFQAWRQHAATMLSWLKKVKSVYSASWKTHLRATVWDHTVLPATRHNTKLNTKF